MNRESLFEYAVLYHPKPTKVERESDESPRSVIVVKPTMVLARDEKSLSLKAARDIPKEYEDKLDQVEIVIRPF